MFVRHGRLKIVTRSHYRPAKVGTESQKITHPQMGSQAFSNKAGGVKGSNPYFDLKECSAKTRGKTLKQLKAT